jgi:CheY-like chemotaxis protein
VLDEAQLHCLAGQEAQRPVVVALVILDLIFGVEKIGWQLLEKMRLNRATADIPVIVCTAAVNEVRQNEGHLTAMGVSVILKPFGVDLLLAVVKEALAAPRRRSGAAWQSGASGAAWQSGASGVAGEGSQGQEGQGQTAAAEGTATAHEAGCVETTMGLAAVQRTATSLASRLLERRLKVVRGMWCSISRLAWGAYTRRSSPRLVRCRRR